jgi:hypothetical protein
MKRKKIMKLVRLVLVAAILLGSIVIAGHQAPAQAQNLYTCADLNDPSYDGYYGVGPISASDSWSFKAGDTIRLIGQSPSQFPTGTMALIINTAYARQTAFPGQITYTFAADTDLISGGAGSVPLGWEIIELTDITWDVSCSAPVAGASVAGMPSPGCDVLLDLPPDAAEGVFVAEADVLWAPNANATTGIRMPAGKTFWVLGMDKTGGFYQFVLACSYLWVPVDKLGPNFDNTWQGTPLPTTVVG